MIPVPSPEPATEPATEPTTNPATEPPKVDEFALCLGQLMYEYESKTGKVRLIIDEVFQIKPVEIGETDDMYVKIGETDNIK